MPERKGAVLFVVTESPVHWGEAVALGAIDRPIQREPHSRHPVGRAAEIRRVLRDLAAADPSRKPAAEAILGPKGAATVCDARILLFPVRSGSGAFAWVTCPFVLSRFATDLGRAGVTAPPLPSAPGAGRAWTTAEGVRRLSVFPSRALLEDESFELAPNKEMEELAKWISERALPDDLKFHKQHATRGLAVVSDDEFRGFVTQSVVIETGANGEQEEHLPSDSVLYSAMFAGEVRAESGPRKPEEVLAWLSEVVRLAGGRWQTGAGADVGRGLVVFRMVTE